MTVIYGQIGGNNMQFIRQFITFRISNPILAGLCYAFSWMMLGAFILSLFLWLSGMQEHDLNVYIYIIHAFSSAVGGMVSGKRSGRKGWVHGGLTGIFYGLIILLIGFLALDNSFVISDISWIGASFVIGAIGGVFGINLKNNM
jgi:putative membrane protein (TIGR04086 family)